jgi:hypothetical protein
MDDKVMFLSSQLGWEKPILPGRPQQKTPNAPASVRVRREKRAGGSSSA